MRSCDEGETVLLYVSLAFSLSFTFTITCFWEVSSMMSDALPTNYPIQLQLKFQKIILITANIWKIQQNHRVDINRFKIKKFFKFRLAPKLCWEIL